MFTKIKSVFSKQTKKLRAACIGVTACIMTTLTPFVYAADGDIEGADVTVSKLVDIIVSIFRYIGILLLAWSIGMLVLAFKNEDADSKSRALMLLVVSCVLIGIKSLISLVVDI
jgi:hypothetical protein